MTIALQKYLDNREESLFSFSKRTGIPYPTLRRLMKTGKARLQTIKRIVRHSNKHLNIDDFTAVPYGYQEKQIKV